MTNPTPPGGLLDPAVLHEMTGLEIFEAILAGALPYPPIGETMGYRLVAARQGHVAFEGHPSAGYYNPLGTVHGGYVATLLDSAVGCAIHTTLPRGRSYTTLELKVNYVRPVFETTGPIRAEGNVIHAGRTTATADGRLTDGDGKLYAHASTTCLIFDAPPPG